ncbi:hypothetical protein NDU88_006415 [Pleurodeles waltl]|uniref:Uncharacterized protein n=1 Tax=Pleurodeles waltl TaxID=8319 RepID=A0AAV7WAI0_PLEWA|nr:hypothetical protein NDU88_006415 [Pleurodeles waltl]
MQISRPTAREAFSSFDYALGAAPGALLSADPGRGIARKFVERRASPLAALRVRGRVLAPPRYCAGIQNRGGRGRKAASSLRLHHLAPERSDLCQGP